MDPMEKGKPLLGGPEKLPASTKWLYAFPSLGQTAFAVVMSTTLLTVYNNRNVSVSFIAITQFVAGLIASYLQVGSVKSDNLPTHMVHRCASPHHVPACSSTACAWLPW